MTALALVPRPSLPDLAELAVSTMQSPHTRRLYGAQLRRYLAWCAGSGRDLSRESVAAYLSQERTAGRRPAALNMALRAIKLLTREAAIRGLIDERTGAAIDKLRYVKERGVRIGNWLTIQGVKTLLSMPDRSTAQGLRDAVVLGLLVGCGLRRAEVATVAWENLGEREGRLCICDFRGKAGKVRTVPVPVWLEADLASWGRCGRTGAIAKIRESSVRQVVWRYTSKMGPEAAKIAPHDLRHTLAKLMRKAGVDLEQIQETLGHNSIATTQRYLGGKLILERGRAGVDQVAL